jgi:hypothetical protein
MGQPGGEAVVEVGGDAGVRGSARRPSEWNATVVDAQPGQGWACPHCAVENACGEPDAVDLVECD